MSASTFLSEVVEAGYEAIELGPYGYLPSDAGELQEALDEHGLTVLAGTVFSHLHLPDSWDYTWKQVTDVAALTRAVGGEHIVVIPEPWRHHKTGTPKEDPDLSDEQWDKLTTDTDRARPADPGRVRPQGAVPLPRRHPRRLPAGDRAVPRPPPTPTTSTSAWTPGTSPTTAATAWS